MIMVIFLLFINLSEGLVAFLSPDELRNITLEYAVPVFTSIEFLQNYGKLVFVSIKNCEYDRTFEIDEVVAVFSEDIEECSLYDLVKNARINQAKAFFAIASDDHDGYSWENNITFNDYSQEFTFNSFESSHLDIFCLVLLNVHSKLNKYKDESPIWIQYSYKQFPRSENPVIEFSLTSNFSRNSIFFNEFKEINTEINSDQFNLFFIPDKSLNYYDCGYEYGYEEENCLIVNITSNKNITYCLYPDYPTKGKERLVVISLIMNYYYTYYSCITDFSDFLSELYSKCNDAYSINCTSNVLTSFSVVPIKDPYVLYMKCKYVESTYYAYSINNVFIYTSKFINEAYSYSDVNQLEGNDYLETCNAGCNYKDLYDLECSKACNNSLCNYDNLDCLMITNCHTFMQEDGYCSSLCPSDPDCSNTGSSYSKNDILLIIIISIIGGILL